jgi:hypothetical protein
MSIEHAPSTPDRAGASQDGATNGALAASDEPNLLREGLRRDRTAPPCALVVFGASGDLTSRKLIPALYNLALQRLLPAEFAMIGVGRHPYDDATLRAEWVREALDEVLGGRDVSRSSTSPAGCSIKWRVELLWWEGCPSHREAEELLQATLGDIGKGDIHVVRREVRGRDEAEKLGFPGSPTFSVGGRDLFPSESPAGLTCRIYQRADGRSGPLPDGDALAERLRDVLARPWELPGWVDFRATRTAS